MRRQILEELGATWTAVPRAERGNDAIRRSARKINKPGGEQKGPQEEMCMIQKATCFALRDWAGVYNEDSILELAGLALQPFLHENGGCYAELERPVVHWASNITHGR